MSAATHLPRIAIITSLGGLLAVASTSSTARATLKPYLPSVLLNDGGFPWRLLTAVLALLNLKCLPLMWHFRLFRVICYHLYFQPTKLPADALFQPIVTRISASPLLECDYNGHKSNSTYFADLDIARSQLIGSLLRKGITSKATQSRRQLDKAEGAYMIALGGVSCHFKREVRPYEAFDAWTRVLCWDRKWIYTVTHLVKRGTVRPRQWTLQPWKKRTVEAKKKERRGEPNGHAVNSATERKQLVLKGIFATSIAKYVVKKGRLTIPPEIVLQRSDLLPPKPEDAPAPAELAVAAALKLDELEDGPPCVAAGSWTWDMVEKERLRGLQLAEKFNALDALHGEFPSAGQNAELDSIDALGSYADLLW